MFSYYLPNFVVYFILNAFVYGELVETETKCCGRCFEASEEEYESLSGD